MEYSVSDLGFSIQQPESHLPCDVSCRGFVKGTGIRVLLGLSENQETW